MDCMFNKFMTSAPQGRYEIFFVNADNDPHTKYTDSISHVCRIDKCTGKVWVRNRITYEDFSSCISWKWEWKEIRRDVFEPEVMYKAGINFQIKVVDGGTESIDAETHCFLIDVNNGRTWSMERLEGEGRYFFKWE